MLNHPTMILSIISIISGLLISCEKPIVPESDCTKGTNANIWHQCINVELNKKGSILFDLNDDKLPDFTISMEKDILDGKVINNIGYMNLINPRDKQLHFDYLVVKRSIMGDTNLMPQQAFLNDKVDSSIYNWLLRLTMMAPNAPLYSYGDLTYNGKTLFVKEGLIDKGDFYIAFRYYDTESEIKGWKNGWILMNVSIDRILVKEIAYHKMPETQIKIGQK